MVHEFPVEPVDSALIKDTNGYGDCFVGGFLSQLVRGRHTVGCLGCGWLAAAAVIQSYGCSFHDHPLFVC